MLEPQKINRVISYDIFKQQSGWFGSKSPKEYDHINFETVRRYSKVMAKRRIEFCH